MENSDIELGTVEEASVAVARLLAVTHATYERRAQLEHALQSRVAIEQAKGVVAERYGLEPEDAFVSGLEGALCDEATKSKLREVGESFDWDTLR